MAPRRRKKLKVTVRRTHIAYRWRSLSEAAGLWARGLLFLGSAVVLAWSVQRLWEKSSLLTISAVTVEGPALPGWADAPPLKPGQSLFSFSARALERRIRERYPQLADVGIRRGWDHAVRVRLVLRTPVLRVRVGDGWQGIDGTGALFPLQGDGAGLPILAPAAPNDPAAPALAFLAALRSAKEPWTEGLYKLKMSPDGEAVLFLQGDLPVYWGEAHPEPALVAAKARRLQRVLSAPETADGLDYARFVGDRRVVVQPRATTDKLEGNHG